MRKMSPEKRKMKNISAIILICLLGACGTQQSTGGSLKAAQSSEGIAFGDLTSLEDRIGALDGIGGLWVGETELSGFQGSCLLVLNISRIQHLVKFTASVSPSEANIDCFNVGIASRDLDLSDLSNWTRIYTQARADGSIAYNLKDYHPLGYLGGYALDLILTKIGENQLDVEFANVVDASGVEIGSAFGVGSNSTLTRQQDSRANTAQTLRTERSSLTAAFSTGSECSFLPNARLTLAIGTEHALLESVGSSGKVERLSLSAPRVVHSLSHSERCGKQCEHQVLEVFTGSRLSAVIMAEGSDSESSISLPTDSGEVRCALLPVL